MTGASSLTYGQIQTISTNLQSYSTQMQSILDEVKMLFSKIGTDDVWSGSAAASTKAEFDRLAAKFPEFSQAVQDCCKYLNTVVANYQAIDLQVEPQNTVNI